MSAPRAEEPRPTTAEIAALMDQDTERLVREILVALCERDGLSLDSKADPGTPARNYELALRLGIGHVFGLRKEEE